MKCRLWLLNWAMPMSSGIAAGWDRSCQFLEVGGAWLLQGISGRLGFLKEELMLG